MTAKEYLKQARSIKIRLEAMAEQLKFLQSAAMYSAPRYSTIPYPANRNIHHTEDAIVRVLEKEAQMKAAEARLSEVVATIDGLKDSMQHSVITKRYLADKTWTEIAGDVYLSERQVRRIHGAALNEIATALNLVR